jgi:Holliday junction DNA helicase RuvB
VTLDSYVGQTKIKPLIATEISHALTTKEQLRHMGFFGSAGVGKTTLSKIIADMAGYTFHPLTGGKEWTEARTSAFLMNLSTEGYDKRGRPSQNPDRHLLFIDEVHLIPTTSFEVWYKPMEECHLDKAGAESWLPFFTVIVATTDPHKIPKPFRDRLALPLVLEPYSVDELKQIILAKSDLSDDVAYQVARRARGIARTALNMAKSVSIHGLGLFERLGIDDNGLTSIDRDYLACLATGTKSLSTIASTIGQPNDVIEGIIEPYLKRLGMIEISGRGRTLTGSGTRGRRGNDKELLSLLG